MELRRAGAFAQPGTPEARDLPGQVGQIEQLIVLASRLPNVLKGEDTPQGRRRGSRLRPTLRSTRPARCGRPALVRRPGRRPKARRRPPVAAPLQRRLLRRPGRLWEVQGRPAARRARPRRAAAAGGRLADGRASRLGAAARLRPAPSPLDGRRRTPAWQQDPDLAGVRDGQALATLPRAEQEAWRDLWSDAEALLKKAQGDRP